MGVRVGCLETSSCETNKTNEGSGSRSSEEAGISVEEETKRSHEHHVRRLKRQWNLVGGA